MEISQTSLTKKVSFDKPDLPGLPTLAQNTYLMYKGETVNMTWSQAPSAQQYQVEILDQSGKSIAQGFTKNAYTQWTGKQSGQYKLRVTTIDKYGRKSTRNVAANIVVRDRPPERQPAQVASSSMKAESDYSNYLNYHYKDSKLSFEGGAMTMYSQENVDNGEALPVATILGLRVMDWSGHHGVEGSLISKIMSVSTTTNTETNPIQAEVRYHYRWTVPFNPFSKFAESQISALVGYEYYRNSTSGLFAPKYDLFKTGLAFTFPVLRQWDTGGELIYGQGLDSSMKYEISGFLSYYLSKQWSLGAGYRVHLFIAGSDASSPLGIPYREAFGEGYSTLRWHY